MRRRMHLHSIRSVIEQALLLSVQEIQFAGIADADLKTLADSALRHPPKEAVVAETEALARKEQAAIKRRIRRTVQQVRGQSKLKQ